MNKLTLLGIATQPQYNESGWTGATIFANIEAEVEDGEQRELHRIGIKLEINPTLAQAVKDFGYNETVERFLMKRVEACLMNLGIKYHGIGRYSAIIYNIMRLKMPRFVSKAADHIFYSQNFRTGEIDECTEDMLDRNV